jgi:hypothetical protein
MNVNLLNAVKALVAKEGAGVLNDARRVDEALPVFANREIAAERRAFLAFLSGKGEIPPALAAEFSALVRSLAPAGGAPRPAPRAGTPPRRSPAETPPVAAQNAAQSTAQSAAQPAAAPALAAKSLSRKTVFFAAAGAVGALLAELATEGFLRTDAYAGFWAVVFHTAVWMGVIALGIVAAILGAQSFYLKKPPLAALAMKALGLGVLSGAVAGGIAQAIFAFTADVSTAVEVVSRVFCWGLAGAGVGFGTSCFVPNYPLRRALPAGFIGGLLGGILFRSTFGFLPEEFARVLSIAILGLCIGATISIVEEMLREAWITVDWGHNETVNVSLGASPVTLGASPQASVRLSPQSYPAVALVVSIEGQKIITDNKVTGQRTEATDGSIVDLGRVKVIVHKR